MKHDLKRKMQLLIPGLLILVILLLFGGKRGRQEDKTQNIPSEKAAETVPQESEEKEEALLSEFNGRIRVLIRSDRYGQPDHERLEITGEDGTRKIEKINGDWHLNGELLSERDFPIILPETAGSSRQVSSLLRERENPSYEGILEIYSTGDRLVLINELPLETYLRYVVPSEMPASYEPEALKAQAVCARSYACMQMQKYAYPLYRAQVDDSVGFQVYGNLNPDPRTDEAVLATAGEILTWRGEVIHAYYFSTSCGHTGTENVWPEGKQEETPYLQAKSVNGVGDSRELTEEDTFAAFLDETDDGCFDREAGWYRWSTYIDLETLSAHINAGLMERWKKSPEEILSLRRGKYVSAPIRSIGTIEKITVLERGEGGVLQRIQVDGSRRSVQITAEYNIRSLLHVQENDILRGDGSTVRGGTMLPSGYCIFVPEYKENEGEKQLAGYTIRGGGLGHGVGMSQNGAAGMAREGRNYREILSFFYTGVDFTCLPGL